VNPGRVASTETYVIKAIWLFACFVLWLYLVVSVVRTRAFVDRIVKVLVCAGCIEALGAVVQRKTGTNVFNHLHVVLPMFNFNPQLQTGQLVRGGSIRATAAAGHPIELSSTMSMLMPLAVYLAVSRRQWRWRVALVILLMGDFAGGSRTGIIGIATILVVYLCLRPRQTLRCWPALIPVLAVVHTVSPGALGAIQASFFPSGGLLQQQSHTFVGHGGVVLHDTRLSRIGPSLQEFSQHNPLFGEGYGTRVVGNGSNGKANPDDNASVLDDQWLGTLLMTGLLGIIGWVWLFARMIRRLAARAKLEALTPESWLAVGFAASTATFATSMVTYDAFSYVQATFLIFTIVALASVLLSLRPVQAPGPDGGPSHSAL
jgi:O-antigen ligase